MENSVKVLQKTEYKVDIQSNYPIPGHISGQNYSSKINTHPPIFIAALFTIAKTWKQPKCSPTDNG